MLLYKVIWANLHSGRQVLLCFKYQTDWKFILFHFADSLKEGTKAMLSASSSKKKSKSADTAASSSVAAEPIEILLTFKRFVYDPDKSMRQS